MECEFCKCQLSNKYSLKFHKQNNKKCLEIQKKISSSENINSELKICEFCQKNFNVTNFKKHILNCKAKKDIENEKRIDDLEKQISEMNLNHEKQISELKLKYEKEISELTSKYETQISALTTKNIRLETENKFYEKDHDIIINLAQQPKTTNTNHNNIVNNLAVYDNKLITDRFNDILNNIKPDDLYDGQESISRFIAPCLKNDDGKKLYLCSDFSRGVYVRKDENGNIVKDINCRNLADIIEPIATKKAEELLEEDYNKRQKQFRLKKIKRQIQKYNEEIENIKEHMEGYKKNSENWNMYNNKIQIIEKNIEKDLEEKEELEYEGVYCADSDDMNENDPKLIYGVDDIKLMKKDCSKFSKNLSKII